ncbi:MAG: hypothetical protein A2506_06005 [Elusimicrobia bacterium RIFOXYD12_FULL_66_9]|nr:MAG: hypothetical protein A2506_06005 [Elusimicrobia bacterium RIFOXYD12_FULL_66_9]
MKKLLGSTLALALFVPASANAELLKNLKVGGQLDVQTTSAENVADQVTRGAGNHDHIGSAYSRAMLKIDWDLLDDVHARLSIVKGAGNLGTGPRIYGNGSESVQTAALTTTFVSEANVKIDKLFGFTDLTLGRQYFGEAGDLIVYYGPRDNYGMSVTALDAGRFDWNGESVSVTGVVGKVDTAGTNTLAPADGAVDLRGLVVSCNKNENVKGSLYVYNALTHNTGDIGAANGKNTNLYVFGLKSKFTFGGLMASAELAKNMGEDRSTANEHENFKGYALLAKVAYKADLQDVGAFTPWGEFGYGTGDSAAGTKGNGNRFFQSINSDYRPGGIYGRFDRNASYQLGNSNVFSSNGLTNRIIWGFGFKATPAALDKLTMGLAFYKYNFHTRVQDHNTPGTNVADSRSIGSEYDLTTEWKHSENVSIKGTLGSFQNGMYIKQTKSIASAGNNPVTMAALDFSIKF